MHAQSLSVAQQRNSEEETFEYNSLLRHGIFEAYSGILNGMSQPKCDQHLRPYVPVRFPHPPCQQPPHHLCFLLYRLGKRPLWSFLPTWLPKNMRGCTCTSASPCKSSVPAADISNLKHRSMMLISLCAPRLDELTCAFHMIL